MHHLDLHMHSNVSAEFDRIEKDILHKQQDASLIIMKKIHDTGIFFDDDKVWDLSVEGVVTGEMIAQAALQDERNRDNALLEPYRNMNSRSDNPFVNFYWDFCSQGKPAAVPVAYIEVSEAVGIIRSAVGVHCREEEDIYRDLTENLNE